MVLLSYVGLLSVEVFIQYLANKVELLTENQEQKEMLNRNDDINYKIIIVMNASICKSRGNYGNDCGINTFL